MLKHCFAAVAAAALLAPVVGWERTCGGQDAQPAITSAVISAPAAPAVPGLPATAPRIDVFAPALGRHPDGGDVLFHVQTPVNEPTDQETRALHEQDRAHEVSTRQLIQQYRAAESGSDRSALQEELASTVREHFEIRQQLRETELAALEARIRSLRELHEKREDAKNEIVEQRVEQLIRNAEGLGWSSGGDGPHAVGVPGPGVFGPSHPQIREERIEVRAPRVSR